MARDDRLQLRICPKLKEEMRRYAKERGVTISDIVEACFRDLLSREKNERLQREQAEAVQI